MASRTDKKNVVIGLGNPFRGDDGVGPLVAGRLGVCGGDFKLFEGPMDALQIINSWQNAPLAVVVDAATPESQPGTVIRNEVDGDPLSKDLARCSSHGLGIAEAVALGKLLGRMPGRLAIFAVEGKTFSHGAAVSEEVASAAEKVVQKVLAEIAAFNFLRRMSTCMKPR